MYLAFRQSGKSPYESLTEVLRTKQFSQDAAFNNEINLTESVFSREEQLREQAQSQLQKSVTPPTLNETAASPTAQSIAIPGIVVIGGLIALYFLSK